MNHHERYVKPWRAANPDKVKAQIKRAYEKKLERRGAESLYDERRAWLLANPHKAEEYKAAARVAAAEKRKGRQTEYQKNHYESISGRAWHLLNGARTRAKTRGIDFDLDREWVTERLNAGICEATGLPLVLTRRGKHLKSPWSPSIDRIDSAGGYLKSNCRVTCWIFNVGKNDMLESEFEMMARAYVTRLDQKADKP